MGCALSIHQKECRKVWSLRYTSVRVIYRKIRCLWSRRTSWSIWCADPWLVQTCGYFIHCHAAIFIRDGFNHWSGLWCHYSVSLMVSTPLCCMICWSVTQHSVQHNWSFFLLISKLRHVSTFQTAIFRPSIRTNSVQYYDPSGFGGLVVSMLASGTQVRGFGRKNPQHAFLRRGSKAVGPMS
jgi:hypothetical protein